MSEACPKPSLEAHSTSSRIEVEGDTFVLDEDFRRESLNGCTPRTGQRYDQQGLPFAFVNGKKMRPVNACKKWLAGRVKRRNTPARGGSPEVGL
jgi:hypothetical protein